MTNSTPTLVEALARVPLTTRRPSFDALRLSFRHRRTIETLAHLDAHLLSDLGLTRGALLEMKVTAGQASRW